jgi:tRNA threonylcarbamoyladenosine biosynthesis protein TsaB
MVERAMRQSGVAFEGIDRLAVTTGPGTFTGQRIGLAFMRGLRIALKKPLIGITTLQAMCAAAMDEAAADFAAAIHDARRGEAYLAIQSKTETLLPPTLVKLDEAAARVSQAIPREARVALAGTAAQLVAEKYGARAVATSIRQPDALWVARLSAAAPQTPGAPRPLYLRAPDAKLPA